MGSRRIYGPQGDTLAALDIGSGKICCLIARLDEPGPGAQPRVVGIGHQVSHGVRSGAISDVEQARDAILSAVQTAEQMAGEQIRNVIVNLSGGQIASRTVGVEVAIAGHGVRDIDLQRVMDHVLAAEEKTGLEITGRSHLNGRLGVFRSNQVAVAQGRNGTANWGASVGGINGQAALPGRLHTAMQSRRLIHAVPVGFSIDGEPGVRDPRGMYGDRLTVQVHLVTANAGTVRTLQTTIEQCHLEIDQFVVSAYAAGLAGLVEDELDLGATVIDMGAGTTTIGVFYDGHLIHASGLPVGGDHVTNDIARGMSTPLVHAERFKTLYGTAIGGSIDDQDTIEIPQVGEEERQASNVVPKSVLNGILRPRLEETFELARARLAECGVDHLAGKRVVLTGGACQLQGVAELAARILDKQVRIGRPLRLRALASSASGPAFATCAGLIAAAARNPDGYLVPQAAHMGEKSGLTGRFSQWVREHL
ncbi:MAG: cell division protein FtsA [Alphaproteobacteria bacterium]|nr:cell division protein FtsA [Alphaproteobacteria bacterium]